MKINLCSYCCKVISNPEVTGGNIPAVSEYVSGPEGSMELNYCSHECYANAKAKDQRDVTCGTNTVVRMPSFFAKPVQAPKATKVRIEYDDGSVYMAKGDDAEKLMQWYSGCEQMAMLHGHQYFGDILLKIKRRPRKAE